MNLSSWCPKSQSINNMALDLQARLKPLGSYAVSPTPFSGIQVNPQTQCAWVHGSESCWLVMASLNFLIQSKQIEHPQICKRLHAHLKLSSLLHFESKKQNTTKQKDKGEMKQREA